MELEGLKSRLAVTNFPVRRPTKPEQLRFGRIQFLVRYLSVVRLVPCFPALSFAARSSQLSL